jgi:predicted dehydrogenase
VLDDRTIDAVDICAPSGLHAQIGLAALAAGKHVLCEKPMATSAADADSMLAAARTAGRKLMIGQHLRFDPSVSALRRALETHPLGEVYYARASWRRRRRLPGNAAFTDRRLSGCGVLFDLGVHVLDLAWWLMGCPRPISAHAQTSNRLAHRDDVGSEWGAWNPHAIDVEDFAAGWLRFTGGACLAFDVSWLALQPETEYRRVEILGDCGGLHWPENILSGETQRAAWDQCVPPESRVKPHRLVVARFAEAVRRDEPVPIAPEESAQGIHMLEGLYRSAAQGGETVIFPTAV